MHQLIWYSIIKAFRLRVQQSLRDSNQNLSRVPFLDTYETCKGILCPGKCLLCPIDENGDLIHKDQESALVMIMDEYGMSLKRLATSILKKLNVCGSDIVLTAISKAMAVYYLLTKEIKHWGVLIQSVSDHEMLQKTFKNRIKREKKYSFSKMAAISQKYC